MSRRVAGILAVQALVVAYLVWSPASDPSQDVPQADDTPPSTAAPALVDGPQLGGPAQAGASGDPEPTAPDNPTVLLHGAITDPNNAPIARLVCGAIGTMGTVYHGSYSGRTGHYARAGIPPGVYRFRALADGFEVHDQMMRIPTGVRQFEYSIRMRRLQSLPVRFLTPDGTPLVDAVPEAQEWLSRSLSVSATIDEPAPRLRMTTYPAHHAFGRGYFVPASLEPDRALRDGRDGTLHIKGDLPVYTSLYLRQERVESRHLARAVDRLDFQVDPGRIRSLLSGIKFRLTCTGDRSALDDLIVLLHDSTSKDPQDDTFRVEGEVYFVDNHPPGTLHLQIHGDEGLAPYFRNVELVAGQTTDLGTIHLDRILRQRFRIVDDKGAPVIGATVWPYELGPGWMAFAGMPVRFTSNAHGVVRTALAGKRYVLRIHEPGRGCFALEADLTGEQPEVVDIRLPTFVPMALRTGEVELPVNVRILDAAGLVVVARKFRAPGVLPLRLAAGSYEMIVTKRDGDERTHALRVAAPMAEMIVIE